MNWDIETPRLILREFEESDAPMVLELLNEVLMGVLGHSAALISVQEDIVNVQRSSNQRLVVSNSSRDWTSWSILSSTNRGSRCVAAQCSNSPQALINGADIEIDLDLVILERNEGERETGVAVEPELERDVQRVLRRAHEVLVGRVGLAARAVIVAVLAALHDQVRQVRHVAHHLRVARLLARLLRELIPDVEPVAVVLVDALATDLNLHVLHQVVAHPVQPAELRTRAVRGLQGDLGERGLEVHAVDQIGRASCRERVCQYV